MVLRMEKYLMKCLLVSLPVSFAATFNVYANDLPSQVCSERLATSVTSVALSMKDGRFDVGGLDGTQPALDAAPEKNKADWQRAVQEGAAWAVFDWSRKDGVSTVVVQYGFETENSCDVFPAEPIRISPIYLPEEVAKYLVKQQGGDGKGDLATLRGKVQHILSTWDSEPQTDEGDAYHDNPVAEKVATTFNGMQMTMLKGSCDKLVIGHDKFTSHCTGDMVSTAYPDRRVGFLFMTQENQAFTFSGMDGENPTKDSDVTLIDKVIINLEGKEDTAKSFKASGKCIYGNAFSGEPMTIVCSGKTRDARSFSAIFTTDGSPPK